MSTHGKSKAVTTQSTTWKKPGLRRSVGNTGTLGTNKDAEWKSDSESIVNGTFPGLPKTRTSSTNSNASLNKTVKFSESSKASSDDETKKDGTAEAQGSKKEESDLVGEMRGLLTVGDFSLLENVTNFIEWFQEHSPFLPRMKLPFWILLISIMSIDTKVDFLMSPVATKFIMKDSLFHYALVQDNYFKYYAMPKTMIVVYLIVLTYIFNVYRFLMKCCAIFCRTYICKSKGEKPSKCSVSNCCSSLNSEEKFIKYTTMIGRVILTYATVAVILFFFTISTYSMKDNFSIMTIEFVDHNNKPNLFAVAFVSAGLTNLRILLFGFSFAAVFSHLPNMINLNEILKEGLKEEQNEDKKGEDDEVFTKSTETFDTAKTH